MISLQLRGRRQIAEPRKYCLVRVIVFFFLWRVFSLIFVSHRLGIWFNSLQDGEENKQNLKSTWKKQTTDHKLIPFLSVFFNKKKKKILSSTTRHGSLMGQLTPPKGSSPIESP